MNTVVNKLSAKENTEECAEPNRPASMYDNIHDKAMRRNNDGSSYDEIAAADDDKVELDSEISEGCKGPFITFITNTTVPQNISVGKLSDRHTPTRNSLRHSRMIVLNKTGKATNPSPNVDPKNKFIIYEILKTSAGFIITAITIWLLIWTPTLKTVDKPYWCGITLLISGIYGLLIICYFQRKSIPKWCFSVNYIEVIGISSTVLSGIVSCIAFIFILLHLISVSSMVCKPLLDNNSTCICQDAKYEFTEEMLYGSFETKLDKYALNSFYFLNIKCTDIKDIFIILFIILSITTAIGAFVSFIYMYSYAVHIKTSTLFYNKIKIRNTNT